MSDTTRPPLDSLTEHLEAHFREFGGLLAEYAVTATNLAISGISSYYVGGWTITPDADRYEGLDRFMLLQYLSATFLESGHEEQHMYRDVQVTFTYSPEGIYVVLDDVESRPSFTVRGSDYAGRAAEVLRDIDTWIDAIDARS